MGRYKLKHIVAKKLSAASQTLRRAEVALQELNANEQVLISVLGSVAFTSLVNQLTSRVEQAQQDLALASAKIDKLIPTKKTN